jgi:hypothetical protein
VYVFTGLLSAIMSVVLVWPSDPAVAIALAPFFGSAAVLVVAVTLLCTAPRRSGSEDRRDQDRNSQDQHVHDEVGRANYHSRP